MEFEDTDAPDDPADLCDNREADILIQFGWTCDA